MQSIFAVFKDRKIFFLLYGLFLSIGIIVLSQILHGDETLFCSRHHTPFWDGFFTFGTRLGEPYTYAVLVIILLFIRYGHALTLPVLGIIVTIVAELLKITFKELRPYNFFNDMGMINELHFVKGVRVFQDWTSFPSGHTMSGFAIFTYLAFIYGKKPWIQAFFFVCAAWVGLSRMYLLQHFLNDVLAGSLVGVFIASLAYYIYSTRPKNPNHWTNRFIRLKS